ncbi:uncharacterized protein [Apostichopus japonicus]|uniref:uncharacterized protein isoform X3 n=1 Tax=Stichopus japonicus TaxID=307972 RepID=UPI003AB325EF
MAFHMVYLVSLLVLYRCEKTCAYNDSLQTTNDMPDACGKYGVCVCGKFKVDCRGMMHDVPRKIPTNTTDLLVHFTNISEIPAKAFNGLSKLHILSLTNNDIDVLHTDSFYGISSTVELYLGYNKLNRLPVNVFDGLRSLRLLNLAFNKLTTITNNLFHNPSNLNYLYIDCNSIQTIQNKAFKGLGNLIVLGLGYNDLHTLPAMVFEDLSSLTELHLERNQINMLPDGTFRGLSKLTKIQLNYNNMSTLPNKLFESLRSITIMLLDNNKINTLQRGTFRGLSDVTYLDLKSNDISHIVPGFFNETGVYKLEILFLQRNKLTIIHRNSFIGLEMLTHLCLFDNYIHTIGDNAFALMNLRYIYLFQNNLTNITGNPFGSNVMEQLHLFGNKIGTFDAQSLMGIPSNTSIYVSCDFLLTLPINSKHHNIRCVTPSSLPSTKQGNIAVVFALITDGFTCDISTSTCTPCGSGSYGNAVKGVCTPCPAGGFYQDDIAQVTPSESKWKIPCKLCNNGTYVKEGHGTAPRDCEVCPEGTNQTILAGLRACYCKANYARTDRYGPCFLCLQEGLDCSQEFQALLPGYTWNWSFPDANLSYYNSFVTNLIGDDIESTPVNYDGELPRVFKCPRSTSCSNDNDNIGGNCARGYTGWLCTNCLPGYYSVLASCVPCPSITILIVETCLFVFICALACVLLTRQIKQKDEEEQNRRSFVDVVIARIKILLGFYQVIGEIFTSLHDINWTGPLVIVGKFISALEINILRLFIRPRCYDEKLDLDPKVQFIIGAVLPLVIIFTPFIYYQAKKLYVLIRFSPIVRMSFQSQFQNLKRCLFACVVVLLFIIYPPVCSVIFSLYPLSCKTFSVDQDRKFNVTRLRSDFDVDCTGLQVYHVSAFILTVIYVIAFPAALLYLLCKNFCLPTRKKDSLIDDLPPDNTDDPTDLSALTNSPTYPSPPIWLNFLSENYKREFWFWEIVELARKVTQTLLITLFGWEDRLTVILTTCISVLFLLLHARYRPMNSSYEQGLQMFSLTVIFINVIVAANDFPDEHENSILTVLVVLNVIVLVIIAGEFIVTVIIHMKHIAVRVMTIVSAKRYRTTDMLITSD